MPVGAEATPTFIRNCQSSFAKFFLGHNVFEGDPAVVLEEALALKVKDVFPNSTSRQINRRMVEKWVEVQESNKIQYRRAFNKLWDARVATGKVPRRERDEYISWMKSKGDPYPPIHEKQLYDEYYLDDGTLAEYFDYHFMNYLYESKRVTVNNLDDYVATLDKSVLRNMARASWRFAKKKFFKPVYDHGAAITITLIITMPITVVNEGFGNALIGQAFTTAFTNLFKDAATEKLREVKDWTMFEGGEEKFIPAVRNLKILSRRFERETFDVNRNLEMKKIDEFNAATGDILPLFRKLVNQEQPNFEKVWDTRLVDSRDSLLQAVTAYNENKIALNQLQNTGANGPDELMQMSTYEANMGIMEEYLAAVLADWKFYKQVRGKENPLESGLDKAFDTVYQFYLVNMQTSLLAKAINERLKAHVSLLETYSKRAAGEEVEEKAVGVKPEDLIKVEVNGVARPEKE